MHHSAFALAAAVLSAICRADRECLAAFECANEDFGVIHSTLNIQGYKSHYGNLSQINATERVDCNGASSCIEANSISAGINILCGGSLSCANVNDLNLKNGAEAWVYAYAVASMASSSISAADKSIFCDGEQSCAYSTISQFTSLYAGGAYSLLNATIEATNTNRIYLSGYYAAFGATLICKTQAQCNIHCYANGCINFNLFCGSNQCIITGNNNSFSPLNIHDLWKYDALIMTQQNDDACSLQMDNMKFDDYQERDAISTTLDNIYGGAICCRGTSSCHLNTIHYISAATSDKSIVCSGYSACYDSDIIVLDGAVYCGGSYSCYVSRITATMLYCYGYSACESSYINRTSTIYCSAAHSCYGSFIKSDGVDLNLYLLGSSSGSNAVVKCSDSDHCSIFCGGYKACLKMSVECIGICTVHCDEYSLCPDVFNLTGNPTAESTDPSLSPSELTTEPSASPTIDTNPPSGSPTKEPNASPSKEPSASPTKEPSESSTIDTKPPSASPIKGSTAAPSNAHVIIVTNYTISIAIQSCAKDECSVNEREIEEILSAFYDIQILSTDILEKETIFVISITTQEYNQISGDIIGDALEAELKRDDVTVTVSVKEISDSNDDDDDKSETNNDTFNVQITIGIIVAFMLLIATASFCIYYFCVQRRSKEKATKQQEMMQIEMKQNTVDVFNNNANKEPQLPDLPHSETEESKLDDEEQSGAKLYAIDTVSVACAKAEDSYKDERMDVGSNSGHDSLCEDVNVLAEGVRQKRRDSELMYVNNADAVQQTEGNTQKTDGNTQKTGGNTKETGGNTKETGGNTNETGGNTKKTGGNTQKTGGNV